MRIILFATALLAFTVDKENTLSFVIPAEQSESRNLIILSLYAGSFY